MRHPDLDGDRVLALSYVCSARRPGLSALWELDAMLGTLVATGTQPAVTQIKLAWWREALLALDERPAPPEPHLQGLHRFVLPEGVRGGDLAAVPSGWEYLLEPGDLGPDELSHYAAERGGVLFTLSAQLLGTAANFVERAGEGWALVDLARRSRSVEDAATALEAARRRLWPENRWPPPLRPLGMLARLARRDAARGIDRIERQGSPLRMLAMLAHRLTGR